MYRFTSAATLAIAGVLLLAGCSSGGDDATEAAGSCADITGEVRSISNGAQNALASTQAPDEMHDYLESLSERVDDLSDQADQSVEDALETLDEAIDSAADFAETLPSDPEAERDADAIAEQQASIQEAANGVNTACSAE